MAEIAKPSRSRPLRWASRLLRIPDGEDYDAWSDSSLQDIEQLVRRSCKSADGLTGCHEEFLAARERLLQEWLGNCPADPYDWGSAKSTGKRSHAGFSLISAFRQRRQGRGDAHCRSHSMPIDNLIPPNLSPPGSQDSVSTSNSRRAPAGQGFSSGDMGAYFEQQNLHRNDSDELSPFWMPENLCGRPLSLRSFKTRMQKAFKKTGDSMNYIDDTSTSPLLADC